MTESTSRRPAYARLLDRAVRILAVRDHSEQELRRKLAAPIMGKNGPEEIDATAEDYERVIAWCHEHVTSTGAHWRAIRRRENMANLCQLSFQKKLRSSVFCSIVAI